MWNLIFPIATAFLGILYLAKDWDDHRTSTRRLTVLLLIIAAGIGGAVTSYYSEEKVTALQASVDAANKSQQDNTQLFMDAFSKFSDKVSDLQSKVDNADLKQEVIQLSKDLASTKKALISPKATLDFSFEKKLEAPVIRQVTLPVIDNVVHVAFTLENMTDISALDAFFNVIICEKCKFASEPKNSQRLTGQPDTERHIKLGTIHQKTMLAIMSVDIRVPPDTDGMVFTVNHRCTNCTIQELKNMTGIVNFKRSIVSPVTGK
jgi:hypothetical protein